MKVIPINRTFELKGDDCCKKSLPSWFVASMNYPTYYPVECLDKFDIKEDKFFCGKCGNGFIYYRMDMGFERRGVIYIPTNISLPFDLLRKNGAPCFVIVHLFCCYGCLSSWMLQGIQKMIDVLADEIDDEWVSCVDKKLN